MKLQPPETRICDECQNDMTLNLFQLNSSKCRYCQEGLPIPKRLIKDKQTESNHSSHDITPIDSSDIHTTTNAFNGENKQTISNTPNITDFVEE